MKAYLVTTAGVFILLIIAHIARVASEGWGPAASPAFIISTILSLAMTGWSLTLLKRLPKT